MTLAGWSTIVVFALVLTALALPLGRYMADVYGDRRVFLSPIFAGPERFLYRVLRVEPDRGQDWKAYARSLLIFSLAGWLFLYLILRTQNGFYVRTRSTRSATTRPRGTSPSTPSPRS